MYHKRDTLLVVTDWWYKDKLTFTVNAICGVLFEILQIDVGVFEHFLQNTVPAS